jgi:hypothetical protein
LDQVLYRAIDCGQYGSNRWVSYEFHRQALVLKVGDTAFASSRVLLRHSAARSADGPTRQHALLIAKAIFRSPTGNIEMLLLIILALLVTLASSLIPLAATDADFTFDAAVAIAGLLSYIGLFGYIFWPQRTSGKSLDRSRRGASVAEGHFETADHLQQVIAVRPAGRAIAGSGLVRRLVRAKDDPAKQRIRAQLSEIDDERLFGLGLTSEDIAALEPSSTDGSRLRGARPTTDLRFDLH